MNCALVMAELEALGTAQNRKVYARHGAQGAVFGVSFADLHKLKKRLKTNHPLALELWQTGNVDARTLATMLADPAQFPEDEAERWLEGAHYKILVGHLASLVAHTPYARTKLAAWLSSERDNERACGYRLLNSLLKDAPELLDDADCTAHLERIEREIHSSGDRSRQAMNAAVIAIGSFKPQLAQAAIASAERIGPVVVDHGETGCKTPSAAEKIRKLVARRARGPARTRNTNRR